MLQLLINIIQRPLIDIFADRHMDLAKIKSIGLDQVNNWSLPLVLGEIEGNSQCRKFGTTLCKRDVEGLKASR